MTIAVSADNLVAALDGATGNVLAQCKGWHRHPEFFSFLQQSEGNVPSHVDSRLIVDNYCIHQRGKGKEWLGQQEPEPHGRGSCPGVGVLTRKINYDFVESCDAPARPFVRVAADPAWPRSNAFGLFCTFSRTLH